MTQYYGIDVSEYQGQIDWEKVCAAGKDFAILRCGYGRYADQIDRCFEQNYRNAKKAGVNVGAYLFSYARTTDQAREEAENCLRFIRGKTFEYPIFYDVETAAQRKLGKEKLSDIVRTFCTALEENGYYAGLYSNPDFLYNALTPEIVRRFDLWLAQWASKPTYTGAYGMWQYSATGTVSGIRGAVDLDTAYKNYPHIMRSKGLNGFVAKSRSSTPDAGDAVTLTNEPLYASAGTAFPSGKVNGTYYLYDGQTVDGRYRITNRPGSVGRKPAMLYVTGWIDASALE